MIAVVFVLAGILAGAVGGMITFGYWSHRATADRDAMFDVLDGERVKFEAMRTDRDVEHARADTLQKQNAAALERLSVAESQRNAATAELAGRVAEGIKNAPTPDAALSAVNDLLSAHLPGAPAAAGAGDGSGKAAAVLAAFPPSTGDAGGRPAG